MTSLSLIFGGAMPPLHRKGGGASAPPAPPIPPPMRRMRVLSWITNLKTGVTGCTANFA